MLECLILGDSIAVGTHKARPECVAYAHTGINSHNYNKRYKKQNFSAKIVVISLGSNDTKHIKTAQELIDLRSRVDAEKVYWVLPANKIEMQEIVENVANMYEDWMIRIPHLSKDGIHPTAKGYKKIGEITK